MRNIPRIDGSARRFDDADLSDFDFCALRSILATHAAGRRRSVTSCCATTRYRRGIHPTFSGPLLMDRVLVTGGAGFLGSHLCERLLAEGAEVMCLDNFSTGSLANVTPLRLHPRFSLINHDITRPYHPSRTPTAVLHLASPASPLAYLASPIDTLRAGSEGTRNALEIARVAEATFLLASTSEVYGDPAVHPQPESYRGSVSTTGPRSVYDEAKRYAEAITMAYHRALGLDTRIARIFNTYGPGLGPGDGRAISNFISQALNGDPLTVYGEGLQTRSFCYVDDLIDGLVTLLRGGGPDPINLGNPDERSILEVARLVIELSGSASIIVFKDLPEDDPVVRCPDISAARTMLGWEPRTALGDGLVRTIGWHRSRSPGTGGRPPQSGRAPILSPSRSGT